MSNNKTTKIVMAALMAAMTYIATTFVQFPISSNGYIHFGDGLVLLSGILLGPLYGGAAAGIGSMLADILTGYAYYAVGTFIIKALAAIVGGSVYLFIVKSNWKRAKTIAIISAGVCGGIIVTVGYFLYSALYLGEGLAAASAIPGNLLQNIFGIVVSTFLLPILLKVPFIRQINQI